MADAAATGAATLFVFRGELNQILTYAYAAANGVQSSAAAQISDVGGAFRDACYNHVGTVRGCAAADFLKCL